MRAAVNMSLGGGKFTNACDTRNPTLTSYVKALKNSGAATVIASGNNNCSNAVGSPGCISNSITVGNATLDPAGNDAVLAYTDGGSNSSTGTRVNVAIRSTTSSRGDPCEPKGGPSNARLPLHTGVHVIPERRLEQPAEYQHEAGGRACLHLS